MLFFFLQVFPYQHHKQTYLSLLYTVQYCTYDRAMLSLPQRALGATLTPYTFDCFVTGCIAALKAPSSPATSSPRPSPGATLDAVTALFKVFDKAHTLTSKTVFADLLRLHAACAVAARGTDVVSQHAGHQSEHNRRAGRGSLWNHSARAAQRTFTEKPSSVEFLTSIGDLIDAMPVRNSPPFVPTVKGQTSPTSGTGDSDLLPDTFIRTYAPIDAPLSLLLPTHLPSYIRWAVGSRVVM